MRHDTGSSSASGGRQFLPSAKRVKVTGGPLLFDTRSSNRTMPVYPGSTILPSSKSLRKLIASVDKTHMIHIVLHWIASAQQSSSVNSDVIEPQLSRRAPRQTERQGNMEASRQEEDAVTASMLSIHEERRARTYEELESLWYNEMVRHQWGRVSIVERILEVDWPHGLTFAMVATVIFESLRAKRRSREWHAVCLDYGDDAEHKAVMGGTGGPARTRLYETVTPNQLKQHFSAEFRNFCTHAAFLDSPVKPEKVRLNVDEDMAPIPEDWTRPFTHVRVAHPAQMCQNALHFLHIPHSPWFLVTGMMGRGTSDTREMALTALAHSLGARRMRMPNKRELRGAFAGNLGELKGRDPIALRDILLSGGLIRDHDEVAGGMPGGKGRLMRRGEAEDGPLVRPEKRRRDDATGLYEDVERKEKGQMGEPPPCEAEQGAQQPSVEQAVEHPAQRLWVEKQRRSEKRKREREVGDLFGHAPLTTASGGSTTESKGQSDDLPCVERISYELYLPFPTMPGYGSVSDRVVRQHPVHLQLHGLHVLAGLRTLIGAGLDGSEACLSNPSAPRPPAEEPQKLASQGLPSWMVEVRGTRVRVGLDDDHHQIDSEDDDDEQG